MLGCYPTLGLDGRRMKMRLQVTADPLPVPASASAPAVTGGIVNIKRAMLDPDKSWIALRGQPGFKEISNAHWCKNSYQLKKVGLPSLIRGEVDAGQIGSILKIRDRFDGQEQWQVSIVDFDRNWRVRWHGPGQWPDDVSVLGGVIADQQITVTGTEIVAFVPKWPLNDIGVAACDGS